MKNKIAPINEIIKDAKKGKMFILVDDKNRENEGDLVIPGSKCNSKAINFMAKNGRGLICLALTQQKVKKLNLPLMSSINKSRNQTAFTVSIEAKEGISTGISAKDRAKTIKIAIKKNSTKKKFGITWSCVSTDWQTGGCPRKSRPYRGFNRYIKISKNKPKCCYLRSYE